MYELICKYIGTLSIALQMYGAILISFKAFKKIHYRDLGKAYSGVLWVDDVNFELSYIKSLIPRNKQTDIFVREILMARISFMLIAIGYVLSMFASTRELTRYEKIISLILWTFVVALISVLLTYVWEFCTKIRLKFEQRKC